MSDQTTSFNDLTQIFKSKNYADGYKLAEQVTGLFTKALITQSGITNSNLDKPLIILDNACGTGIISSTLNDMLDESLKQNWELTCGDFAEGMVEFTRKRAGEQGWHNTEVKVVDAQSMGLDSGKYSHVFTAFAFPMIPDTPGALKECLRVLQPGGTYASTNWKSTPQISLMLQALSPLSQHLPLPSYSTFHASLSKNWDSESFVASQLADAGFVDIKTEAVTVRSEIPIDDFLELSRIAIPGFFGRFWSKELMETYGEQIPGVMRGWFEGEFGVGGNVPLEPVAIVATARKP